MSDTNPAGWQPDPTGRHEHRYWDGTTWTDNVSNAGVASTDPVAGAGDEPTAVTPTAPADPTAAWSTTPGAPIPPLPQPATASSNGNGGSKKGLLIGGAILAAVIILVIAALAFGGDDKGSTDALRADLVGLMTDEGEAGFSQRDAECAAGVVIDEIGADRLEGVDFDAEEPPPGLEDDFGAAMLKAVQHCNIDMMGGNIGGGDTTTTEASPERTTTTAGTTPTSTGGSTDLPADFEKLLADTYESTFGLSRPQAECLAGKLSDSIKSGELSENQAASAVFDYLADCDISLDEFGTN